MRSVRGSRLVSFFFFPNLYAGEFLVKIIEAKGFPSVFCV